MERRGWETLESLSRIIERTSALLAGSLLIINIMDIVMGIVFRYLLKNSVIWTEEVARYSLVWLVMLGAAGALTRGDHMAIDFLVPKFPGWLKKTSVFLRLTIQVIVLFVLIWYGAQSVRGTWHMKTMALGIPKAIVLMAVPLGMSILLVQLLLLEFMKTRKDENR
ncbi:TRAP transporter small permease [Thermovirga lienii]|uniref:TRAP transporter small permease n=1 Tax=Thermovirga lienii TaxID=336261 RepID=UPI002FDF7F40